MKISSILVSLLLLSGFIAGFYSFYYNIGTQYGVTGINDTGLASISYIATVSNFTNSIQTNTTAKRGFLDTLYTDTAIIFGVFENILTLPVILIAVIWDFVNVVSAVTSIPPWFTSMCITIISVLVIFKVVEFFTNREA